MPYVSAYTKTDGTRVRGYYRRRASRRSSPANQAGAFAEGLVGLLVLLVVVYGLAQLVDRHPQASARVSSAAAVAAHPSLGPSARIVQVSSHRGPSSAKAAADDLRRRGMSAGVLRSDQYKPLVSGFYVVYVGPYPNNASGMQEAQRVAARLGGKVQDVSAR